MNQETGIEDNIKLYSQAAILIATFFGGPIAAGILMRRNFINLGKESLGRNSLIIGIITTILLFAGIFSFPEDIVDKIPSSIIPAIYTGIIAALIQKYQGRELKRHKHGAGLFYSIWRAIGVGTVCLLIIIGTIFAHIFLEPDNFDEERYESRIEEFQKNEQEALRFYQIIQSRDDMSELIGHLENIGIPAWKRNLAILDELDSMDDLYDELQKQNKLLREYSTLRLEVFRLIRDALIEDVDVFDSRIEQLHSEIERLLDKLNE